MLGLDLTQAVEAGLVRAVQQVERVVQAQRGLHTNLVLERAVGLPAVDGTGAGHPAHRRERRHRREDSEDGDEAEHDVDLEEGWGGGGGKWRQDSVYNATKPTRKAKEHPQILVTINAYLRGGKYLHINVEIGIHVLAIRILYISCETLFYFPVYFSG